MAQTVDHAASATTGKTPTVLVYTPGIRGYFVDGSDEYVGGREQQYSQLVPRLHQNGLDVHAVVYNAPDEDTDVTYHEIRHPDSRQFTHLSFLRDVTAIYRNVDPDIMLQSGAQASTYIFRMLSGLHGVPFVFHWATDADQSGEVVPPKHVGPPLYRASRRRADLNIVQTQKQADLIDEPAVVIPNILDTRIAWKQASGDAVLWLATIEPAKSPERFVELARALPHREFRMAGRITGPDAFQNQIRNQIETTPNITHLGQIPREEIPTYLSEGRCLVNTSDYEGFSNTYLEAACSKLPIVSLFHDPNDMIEQQTAGIVVDKSPVDLPTAVETMFDDSMWNQYRTGCEQIVRDHEPDPIVQSFSEALRELAVETPNKVSVQ